VRRPACEILVDQVSIRNSKSAPTGGRSDASPDASRSGAKYAKNCRSCLATALTGCDAINTVSDGFKHVKAIETDIAEVTGLKPSVGFNWNNGKLTSVTVTFPKLYEDKPLRELAAVARAAVTKEFKQTPGTIFLSFALGAGTTAEAVVPHAVN
jgi:hypothetical protein